jgi:hypothetical protein
MVLEFSKYLVQQTRIARMTGTLGAYFNRTKTTLIALAHVVRDFGMGFLNIMRVASGQSGNFAGSIERVAKAFRTWTENFNNQARVALWFQRAQDSAHRLGRILVNVFQILTGIGKASQQLGGSLTMSIEKTTRRWSQWVNSFQGQNAINIWMNGMRQTLGQIWGLISDLGGAFGRMSAGGGGAVGLLRSIRSIIPDLERLLTAFSKNIGPGLFGTVAQLAHLIGTIAGTGASPLGTILNTTNSILQSVNHLLDRFRMVRVAVVGAVVAIGGAILIRKLQSIAANVGNIARQWMGVTAAESVATEGVARFGAATAVAGGARGAAGGGGFFGRFGRGARTATPGITGVPMMGGMTGFPRAVGAGGAVAGAASVGRMGRLMGMLGRPGVGLGAGIALPMLAGVGTELAASGGLISQNRAGQIQNVASMAGTGALLGSFVAPGIGTAVGAGVGAGAGLLMNAMSGGGGPSKTDAYLQRLQGSAKAGGFDINAVQGGAGNLAGAERYQHILDQSREQLLARRARAANAPTRTAWAGGRFGAAYRTNNNEQVAQVNKLLEANQRLRLASIGRLGVERRIVAAQKEQANELRRAAHARFSRGVGAHLATSFGTAYNVYRGAGMTTDRATALTLQNVTSRMAHLAPPAARVLAAQTSAWLRQQVKLHPELKKEQARWDSDLKDTFKRMHITVTTAGGKILDVTKEQWQKIATAMQDPAEKAREKVSQSFTALQNQAKAVLIGMGYSAAEANNIIRTMEAGGAGPVMSPRKGAVARRARGGRIPGSGFADNVPIGPGAMAAPGELIVNRHTESRIDKVLRLAAGTTLGREVAGEQRPHAMGLGGDDILPDSGLHFAKGGRLARAIAEANRIASLRIPYKWGGGHSTPSPGGGPWDCSSAVSRVLQTAGYDIPTMTSGSLMKFGNAGPGPLAVAANMGHAYMVLNNRAWGTSSMNPGGGPGWIDAYRYRPGFTIRHAPGAGGGGALGLGLGGLGAGAMMGPLDYSMFGQGLGGVPLALGLRTGHIAAEGIRRKVNRALRRRSGGAVRGGGGGGGGGTSGQNQALARSMMMASGWGGGQWPSLKALWTQESGFRTLAENASSGAYGIPQSLPGTKMASAGPDWRTNPATQIRWGLDYIKGRYGSPDAAMAHERAFNWYGHGGRMPEWGGWHGNGMDATFHKPTMIGVGEKGPERVTVGPARGGGLTINHMEIVVHGHQPGDVKREVEAALVEVARAIDRAPTTGGA